MVMSTIIDLHASAWKKLFGAYLAAHAARRAAPFVLFDVPVD